MDAWDGWPFARVYLLVVSVAIIAVGAQAFLLHWRAAFRSKAMYGPVVMAPVLAAAGIAAAVVRNDVVGWIAAVVFAIGFVEGLIGLGLHLRGIAVRVGGFTVRNLLVGPPPVLPLAFGVLALTGGLAVVWQTW
jgi:hypothetical protein